MTTVVYDGKTLAADRQVTYGRTKQLGTKVYRLKDVVVGICGDASKAIEVVDWLSRGSPKRGVPDDVGGMSLIMVSLETGECWTMTGSLSRFPCHPPVSIGSGCMAALAALHCGATAVQAVEAASNVDIYTGGGVDYVDIKPSKNKRKKK